MSGGSGREWKHHGAENSALKNERPLQLDGTLKTSESTSIFSSLPEAGFLARTGKRASEP
mgnify:CR=1 FL=1